MNNWKKQVKNKFSDSKRIVHDPILYEFSEYFGELIRHVKKVFSLMCFFLFFSCGLEDKENSRNEWIGKETEFKQKFISIKEGNETLILNKSDSKPFDGKIERTNSHLTTTQNFEKGKLNGLSIKRSKDGSWVEANYIDGKLDGNLTFFSKKGVKRMVLKYKNGSLVK